MKHLITILLACILTACSSWVSVKKVEVGTEKGRRYHLPMTIVKVEPSPTGNGEFTIGHEAVADPSQLYAIGTGSFLATNNTIIETSNGLLTSVSLDGDATAVAKAASDAALTVNKEKRKAKEAEKTAAKAAAITEKSNKETAIATWKGTVKTAENTVAATKREIQVVLDTNTFREEKIKGLKDGELKTLQGEIATIEVSDLSEEDKKSEIILLQGKVDVLQGVILKEENAIETANRALIGTRSRLLGEENALASLTEQHADWAPFLTNEVMNTVQVDVVHQSKAPRSHRIWGPVYYRLVDNYDHKANTGSVKLVALTYGQSGDDQRSFQSMIPITPANRPPVGSVSATGAGKTTVTPAELKSGVPIKHTKEIELIVPGSISFTSLPGNVDVCARYLSVDVVAENNKQVKFKCAAGDLKEGEYRLNYRYQVGGTEFSQERFYNVEVAAPAQVSPPILGIQGEQKVSCDNILTTDIKSEFSSKVSLVPGSVKVFPKPASGPVGPPRANTIALNIEDGTKLSISWLQKLEMGAYKIAFDLIYKVGDENESLHQVIFFAVDECSDDS